MNEKANAFTDEYQEYTSGVQVTYAYNPKGWSVYISASIIW